MRQWLCALGAAFALAGCASVESVKQEQGKGVKRSFRQPYEAVYQAVLNASTRRQLEVIDQDRAAGRVILSNNGGWTSLGERIAVFVTRGNGRSTGVEVVSRPVGGPITFPPDWPALLFGDMDQELTIRRPK